MRAIKFRGKALDTGEWLYGDLVHSKDGLRSAILTSADTYDECEVRAETVGQFTGLTDKNGKEIYEGDICRIEDCVTWMVEWNNEQACFSFREENGRLGISPISIFRHLTEIIGNTHDNPELLKGGL